MDDSLRELVSSWVSARAAEQLEYTVRLCNQNSYTYNVSGTNLVSGMVLDGLGGALPQRRTLHQDGLGDHHILGTRPASKGVYLLGHIDTVFPPEHPFRECTITGDWLTGPGTGDMKGGLAVVVYALRALHELRVLDGLDIALILTADEEIGAVTSRTIYEGERANATSCLVAECAGPDGEVVTSRNGKAGLELECCGEDSHVGRISKGKRSAVLEMAHKVVALEALNGCFPGVTVNVGKIEGGLGPCTVAARARCLIDARWLDDAHYEALLDEMTGIVEKPACPGCSCRLKVLNHRPAMPLTDGSEGLYVVLEKTAQAIGLSVGKEHRRGTSDANFFGSAGVPTLDGLGPVCLDDHTPKERILIPSLASRTILLALLLAELGQ